MNAMLLKRRGLIFGLLIVGALASAPLQAADNTLLQQAQACTDEDSRVERLNCYDALFKDAAAADDASELPALWYAIERQEAARPADNVGLVVQQTDNSVLISVPALGTTPPRPVMVMACEKLITRFQLHLATPLNDARVVVQLTGNGATIEQQWRVRDGGRVVSGGRGLPAIETLRQLLNASDITLRSDVAELDGLRFNVAGLRQDIQPLREACRW